MKKVSVKTIRELAKERGFGTTYKETFEGIEIVFNNTLSIETKRELAEAITKASFVYDEINRAYRQDGAVTRVMKVYFVTKYYTNINVMSDPFEMYDNMISSGMWSFIVCKINQEEYREFSDILEERIEEEYRMEEVKYTAGKQISEGIELLNEKLKEGLEAIENFNAEDLTTLKNILPKEEREKLSSQLSDEEEDIDTEESDIDG